jgi:hypothetical protein
MSVLGIATYLLMAIGVLGALDIALFHTRVHQLLARLGDHEPARTLLPAARALSRAVVLPRDHLQLQ